MLSVFCSLLPFERAHAHAARRRRSPPPLAAKQKNSPGLPAPWRCTGLGRPHRDPSPTPGRPARTPGRPQTPRPVLFWVGAMVCVLGALGDPGRTDRLRSARASIEEPLPRNTQTLRSGVMSAQGLKSTAPASKKAWPARSSSAVLSTPPPPPLPRLRISSCVIEGLCVDLKLPRVRARSGCCAARGEREVVGRGVVGSMPFAATELHTRAR